MVKQPARVLALIAMMACIVNAQCAVSCSLQPIAASSATHESAADPNLADHECCPHPGAPQPKQQKNKVPCPHAGPPANDVALGKSGITLIPGVVAAGVAPEYRPRLVEIDHDPPTASASPGLSHLSSIFILRI
jgi:hypothetical protein